MRLAIAVYAIPLLMIYTPLVTGNWLQRFGVFGWTAFGFLMLAMANAGYFKGRLGTWTRFGAGLAALFLFFPSRTLHIIAAVAGFAFLIWRLFSSRQIQVHVPARNKLISNQDKQSDQ
jgi:TRAP-type uncharacterized transport system fused permease subunit